MQVGEPAYPRDMVGYGTKPIDPKWPNGARLAIQIALNYEAGAESCVLHGDQTSESMLTDIGFPAVAEQTGLGFRLGQRRPNLTHRRN